MHVVWLAPLLFAQASRGLAGAVEITSSGVGEGGGGVVTAAGGEVVACAGSAGKLSLATGAPASTLGSGCRIAEGVDDFSAGMEEMAAGASLLVGV